MFYSGEKIIICYEGNGGRGMKWAKSLVSPIMHKLLIKIWDLKNLMEEKGINQVGFGLWALKKKMIIKIMD